MGTYEFIIFLIIAAVAGTIAETVTGFQRGGGLIFSIAAGLVGGLLGEHLAQRFSWPALLVLKLESRSIDVAWTVVGAVILVFVLGFVRNALGVTKRDMS